ncbi:hypothetical protein CLV51_105181 [Chitinophaga niastensis]|uniref:Patatin-like phospholipase n=1 Tax=Chitinophaga niastensis TaxID=536980 RepID=A0A2P8HF11_CHINA|nr:hypothetical protein [Chitinophaga niastensis]PSL44809.1 hypothetical protein CLV51_105181 [Chitinophaga niastensis]
MRALRFISHLLRAIWLFFPGILFLLLIFFISWTLNQGKDVIIAFTENRYGIRIIFFLAIGFWVYVSWYSSRIISYTKKSKQISNLEAGAHISPEEATKAYNERNRLFEISQPFLDEFPRIIGNTCFLLLELALLQSPALSHPIPIMAAWIILGVASIGLLFLNGYLTKMAKHPFFRTLFYILLFIWLALTIISNLVTHTHILTLLGLLLLMHVVFLLYIHLRRFEMDKRARQGPPEHSWLDPVMNYFCIPLKEKGYFCWLLFIGLAALIFYVVAINNLRFARQMGPFPYLLLASGMLLLFGNVVTAFSVRFRLSFHFILIVLALIFGLKEVHNVRTLAAPGHENNYSQRPSLRTYLQAWLNTRNVSSDSTYDMYFVMANGGASRSAYWTAAVLGKIEDASIISHKEDRFSKHIFCLSGTSGGGVGVATFFALLRDQQQTAPKYTKSAMTYLKQDYFSYTFARMLGPDFFQYILRISSQSDRAAALEESFEKSTGVAGDSLYTVPFDNALSAFPAMKGNLTTMPILCINTTRMQDGNPGVVSNLRLDSNIFNNRVDVLSLLRHDSDITITAGAILGARFPYLSPAGRIKDQYFVDGGYFDNSGAGVIQEIIRGITNIADDDLRENGANSTLYKQISKLNFKVLHITNSPVIPDKNNFKSVAPIKNDLFAPVLTIIGAYDMQTTVNDIRLQHFLYDINNYYHRKASYTQIPLYKDSLEWQQDPLRVRFPDKEPSYTMNWFMSDTTINRINLRLAGNKMIDTVLAQMGR